MSVTIKITRSRLKKILDHFAKQSNHKDFANYIDNRIDYKFNKDSRYKSDRNNMVKRLCTDSYSEAILWEFSGRKFIPNFEVSQSKNYNYPDFKDAGFNMGLKTSNIKNPHLIQKPHNVKYNELMAHIDLHKDHVEYIILGVATIDIMKEYGDENLVLSPSAKKYKNGFNRYDLLKPVYSFDNLSRF